MSQAPFDRQTRARDVLIPLAWMTAGLALGAVALLRGKPAAATEPPRPETMARWEDDGGRVVEPDDLAGDPAPEDWVERAEAARTAARERLLHLYEEGRATAEAKAEVAATMARGLAEAFREGLADLGNETADRIARARQRNWEELEEKRAAARARANDFADAAEETVEMVSSAVAREAARARKGAQSLARKAGEAAQEGSASFADSLDEALEAAEGALRRAARKASESTAADAPSVQEGAPIATPDPSAPAPDKSAPEAAAPKDTTGA
ncbi:hypothetical protein CKO11_07430 [Rhodobacter sp. TJ_12]|uniref:hypothetical protein n=1 Tax=Rhodobacter sp. TJ_12 TaxID=2029399 RepID=UPI001CC0F274|nr:hypothetical protein [Rhodobacter sp. TJ_12]MBZ4022287.1 hypothetical protein [Rhodobacter sp. TJ_12]